MHRRTYQCLRRQYEAAVEQYVGGYGVAAAIALLDRGWGKAVQHIEAEISVYDSLGLAEKQALLEVIDSLIDGDEEGNSDGPALTHH